MLNGSIENLGLTNVSVTAQAGNVGAMVGSLGNGTAISGFTGFSTGSISQSYVTGTVIGPTSGSYQNFGGMVGANYNGSTISDSYSMVNVTGDVTVGGLVGYNSGLGPSAISYIDRSYSTGTVHGSNPSHTGGLVGYNQDGQAPYSFWDVQTSGIGTASAGNSQYAATGKTTADLQTLSTFTDAGWNISTTTDSTYAAYPYAGISNGGSSKWVLYAAPTTINYTLSNILSGYTYTGSPYLLSNLWSSSAIFGNSYSSWVAGTDYNFVYNNANVTSFTNAGTYSPIQVALTSVKSNYVFGNTGNTNGMFVINAGLTPTNGGSAGSPSSGSSEGFSGSSSTDNIVSNIVTTIVNSTTVTPPSVVIVSPAPQPSVVQTQTTQLLQNIMPQSNGEHYNLVGTTDGMTPIQTVSMEQLQKASKAQGVNDVRVALGQESFVELINGGVNLPIGVSQEFYVVNNNNQEKKN